MGKKLKRTAVFLLIVTAVGCAIYYLPRARFLLRWFSNRATDVLFFVEGKEKRVALTIDDGPHPEITPEILDILALYGAKATFFPIGERIVGNELLLERMVREGHELGNHTMVDTPTIKLSEAELIEQMAESDRLLRQFAPIRWFRPGSAWYNQKMIDLAKEYQYQIALGDIYPYDAQLHSPKWIARYILQHTMAGSVIILHDGQDDRRQTIEILEEILPKLQEQGYAVVTLSELVDGED